MGAQPGLTSPLAREHHRHRPADASPRQLRRQPRVVGIGPQHPLSAPAPVTWQPGRIHQLAKMKLIDLIALYQSMLPNQAGEHDQVAQMAAGGWTRDQVITAIRNLEAPYEEVGGWKRAMQIIGACQRWANA
jgi:hypothetical protein